MFGLVLPLRHIAALKHLKGRIRSLKRFLTLTDIRPVTCRKPFTHGINRVCLLFPPKGGLSL